MFWLKHLFTKTEKPKKRKKNDEERWWQLLLCMSYWGAQKIKENMCEHTQRKGFTDIVLFMPICVTILFCLSLNLHKAPLWKPQWRPRSIQVYRSTKASVYNPNRDLVVGAVDVSKVIQGPEGLGDSRAGDFVPGIHLFGLFFRAAPAFHAQVGEGV